MKVLFLLLIVAIVYYVFHKGNGEENKIAGTKNNKHAAAELSPEEKEKKAEKVLLELKKTASKQYGRDAVDAMWELAFKYGTGSGVPRDLKKSEELHRAVMQEVLYLKEISDEPNDYYLFRTAGDSLKYSPEELINFYIDGYSHPVDLDLAQITAETLIWAGELKAGYILKEIEELRLLGYQDNAQTKESRFEFLLSQAEAGCTQAMYRIGKWYEFHGFGNYDDDKSKAKEWKIRARQSGSLSVLLEKYPMFIGDEEDEIKRREFACAYSKARSIYMQAKEECLDRVETMSEELYVLNNRLGTNTDMPVENVISTYVREAGWPEPMPYQVPGYSSDQKSDFQKARYEELLGKDFNNVDSLYKPLVEAGNSEAIRRLGNIKRNVLYKTWGDELFTEGEDLLKKSASMGNVLASWQINEKPDPSKMAALACTGDWEAIFALADMIGKGEGGPANPLIKRAMLWFLKGLIGKQDQIHDGETVLFELKVGKELGIHLADGYYEANRYFRAHKMDYAPGTMGLLRTFISRNGYVSYEKELAEKAMRAGFGRAEILFENAREEERKWERHVSYILHSAQSGKDFFQSINPDPNARIEYAKQHLTEEVEMAKKIRGSSGLPSEHVINLIGKPLDLIDLKEDKYNK